MEIKDKVQEYYNKCCVVVEKLPHDILTKRVIEQLLTEIDKLEADLKLQKSYVADFKSDFKSLRKQADKALEENHMVINALSGFRIRTDNGPLDTLKRLVKERESEYSHIRAVVKDMKKRLEILDESI